MRSRPRRALVLVAHRSRIAGLEAGDLNSSASILFPDDVPGSVDCWVSPLTVYGTNTGRSRSRRARTQVRFGVGPIHCWNIDLLQADSTSESL